MYYRRTMTQPKNEGAIPVVELPSVEGPSTVRIKGTVFAVTRGDFEDFEEVPSLSGRWLPNHGTLTLRRCNDGSGPIDDDPPEEIGLTQEMIESVRMLTAAMAESMPAKYAEAPIAEALSRGVLEDAAKALYELSAFRSGAFRAMGLNSRTDANRPALQLLEEYVRKPTKIVANRGDVIDDGGEGLEAFGREIGARMGEIIEQHTPPGYMPSPVERLGANVDAVTEALYETRVALQEIAVAVEQLGDDYDGRALALGIGGVR